MRDPRWKQLLSPPKSDVPPQKGGADTSSKPPPASHKPIDGARLASDDGSSVSQRGGSRRRAGGLPQGRPSLHRPSLSFPRLRRSPKRQPSPPRGFRVLAPALRLPLKRAQQSTQAINLHCSLESHYQATAMRLAAERRAATSRTGALSKPANDGEEVRSAVSAGLRYEQPSPWKKGINRVSAASQPQQMAEDRKEGARRAAQRRDAWTRPIMTGSWPHQPCRALKEETEIDGTPIMTPH